MSLHTLGESWVNWYFFFGSVCNNEFFEFSVAIFFSSFLFNLPSFTPPVRVTVGEVRYSIEIDVGGGKGQFYKTRF